MNGKEGANIIQTMATKASFDKCVKLNAKTKHIKNKPSNRILDERKGSECHKKENQRPKKMSCVYQCRIMFKIQEAECFG